MWTMSASPAWLPSIIYYTCASMQPKHLPWVQTSLSQAPPGKVWCFATWWGMMLLYNICCKSSFSMKYLYKMNIYLYTCAIGGKSTWNIYQIIRVVCKDFNMVCKDFNMQIRYVGHSLESWYLLDLIYTCWSYPYACWTADACRIKLTPQWTANICWI